MDEEEEETSPFGSVRLSDEAIKSPAGRLAVKAEARNSQLGLWAGLAIVGLGVLLFVLGVAGTVNWLAHGPGFESRLSNASPGALVVVVGAVIVFVTRMNVRSAGR